MLRIVLANRRFFLIVASVAFSLSGRAAPIHIPDSDTLLHAFEGGGLFEPSISDVLMTVDHLRPLPEQPDFVGPIRSAGGSIEFLGVSRISHDLAARTSGITVQGSQIPIPEPTVLQLMVVGFLGAMLGRASFARSR